MLRWIHMNNANQPLPYKQLGEQLRRLRQKNCESLIEVSGAVEIESTTLLDFENGVKRPSEDILMLLISHFNSKEFEANELWKMAGYSQPSSSSQIVNEDFGLIKPIVMMIPLDGRIVYTDTVQVKVNHFGVVVNFKQDDTTNQSTTVARVGMSKDHARSLMDLLRHSLDQIDQPHVQKQLPAPKPSKSQPKDTKKN